jgi:dissimilatory sulfite reductase (desulfoviridin) alpha/beta subunit
MRIEYQIPGGGPTVKADVRKGGSLVVHKQLGGKGYVVTDLETGRVILRRDRKADALAVVKELEKIDLSTPEAAGQIRAILTVSGTQDCQTEPPVDA